MLETASFRQMHPVAQQLVAKLFEALAQEVEDLVAMDRSKMSLAERGRWSSQALRLLKALQKDYPEASETTKEGRLAIHRLKTPDELDAEEAEFDALLGLPPRKSRTPLHDVPGPQRATCDPSEGGRTIERHAPWFEGPNAAPVRSPPKGWPDEHREHSAGPMTRTSSATSDIDQVGAVMGGSAEIADVLWRIRTAAEPPSS